ncbi:MAG: hypothetical protein QM754_13315 [Tepidisphaeraceae bacterium]
MATLKEGSKLFTNREYFITKFPPELGGLQYVRHPSQSNEAIEFDVPAGKTVYVLINKPAESGELRKKLVDDGWTLLPTVVSFKRSERGQEETTSIYSRTYTTAEHFRGQPAGTLGGGIVVADRIELISAAGSASTQPTAERPTEVIAGPTTRPAARQVSIRALEIYRTDSGLMLGDSSEVTLTLTPGEKSHVVGLTFATGAGQQMQLARDDALRFIRLQYPNWYADRAELTFEDKYTQHDGGSIGTALGTLVLSAIEGFAIDPNVAITGDISANGKVRAIGGVAAKLKGAIAAKCHLTALPADNYEQLVDAVIYNGPSLITDTQVIAIDTLPSAIAAVRQDRAEAFNKSINDFDKIVEKLKTKPNSLHTKEIQDQLAAIEQQTPQHFSSKVLSLVASNKLPKTLSATASYYYISLAVDPVMDLFKSRDQGKRKATVALPSAVVKKGLKDLRSLRPIANENTRPMLDAWVRFIEAVSALQEGTGAQDSVERARQNLLDEMNRKQTDADLMQKMLKEGI